MRDLWENRTGCLSIQVLQEFYVNVTRKISKPMSPEAASQIIADLGVWPIHRPEVTDVLEAIRLGTARQLSFWDAMILTSARRLGCTILWSENLSDGQVYEMVEVRSPFAQ